MSASLPDQTPNPIPTSGPIAITGPLSIPDLLDRSFRALRARFGILILSAATVMVPLAIITVLIFGRFLTGYFELLQLSMQEAGNPNFDEVEFLGDMLGYMGTILLVTVLYALASSLVTLMTIHHIQHFLHGESSTLGEGWRAALRRLLPMIGMQIAQFLVIAFVTLIIAVGVGMIFFVIALIFGGAIAALENETAGVFLAIGMVMLFLVGYLLLIVLMLAPSIFFMGRWLAAAPSLVIEELGPIEALRRSWGLTKQRMWRGILFLILLTVFSMVVISLPVGVGQWITMIVMPDQLVLIGVIFTALSYLLNLFYQPFYATGTVLFYYDLRVRAEAYDVALRVAALEAELAPDAPTA